MGKSRPLKPQIAAYRNALVGAGPPARAVRSGVRDGPFLASLPWP